MIKEIPTVTLRNGEDAADPLVRIVYMQLNQILEAGYQQKDDGTYGPGGPGVIYELARKAADPTHQFYHHARVDEVIAQFGLETWFEEDEKTGDRRLKPAIAGIVQSTITPDSNPLTVRLQDPTTKLGGQGNFLKFPIPKSP